MNTARRTRTLALILGLVIVSGAASAEPFMMPPENQPEFEWATSFPYPRNIYWDFAEDPRGGPSPDGAPGAHYEGWDDPSLKVSDYVEFTGDVQLYDYVENQWGQGHSGLIGIDNRFGTTTLTGSAIFHIDNSDRPDVKHIYFEAHLGNPDRGELSTGTMSVDLILPAGYEITDLWSEEHWLLGDVWWGDLLQYATVLPNPPWEEIVFTITAAPGEEFYVDSLHVATECIPEPAGLGVVGLALLAARRKRT